jgi:hypothetical protein
VARALERGFCVGDALAGIDEAGGLRIGVERRVLEQRIA